MKSRSPRITAGTEEQKQITRVSYMLILASLGAYVFVGLIGVSFQDVRLALTMCGGSVLLAVPYWLLKRGRFRAGNMILMVMPLPPRPRKRQWARAFAILPSAPIPSFSSPWA